MDDNGFVTVAEGAKLVGVSTSALYQRIKKGDLETVSEDGVTKLWREDLIKLFQLSNEAEKEDSQEGFKVLSKQLEVMQKECEVKNQQIHQLHQQIDHLTQLLAMKEKNTETQLMLMSAEKKRLPWWRRWLYKKKDDDKIAYYGGEQSARRHD